MAIEELDISEENSGDYFPDPVNWSWKKFIVSVVVAFLIGLALLIIFIPAENGSDLRPATPEQLEQLDDLEEQNRIQNLRTDCSFADANPIFQDACDELDAMGVSRD